MVATREVTYDVDGLTMVGHLARPDDDGPWPTVLVGHDGVGLDDFQRRRADHLAEQGYLALAMDYHGGRYFGGRPEAMLARALPLIADPGRLREIERVSVFSRVLQEAGVDWRAHIYGGAEHGFWSVPVDSDGVPTGGISHTRPTVPGASYHPAHTARAWRAVLDLLAESVGALSPIR